MKRKQTGLYILIVYVLMQLSGAIFAPPLFFLFKKLGFENPKILASGWWIFISFAIATIITLLILRKDKHFIRPLKGQAASTPTVIGWGILGFFMVLLSQILAANIEIKIGIEPGSQNTADFMSLATDVPFVIFSIVLFAPILEELIFRRLIFGTLLPKTNFFVAALVSSLAFAVIHLEFVHILIYAASGFVFAFLYYKTKRILTSIIAHILLNGYVVVVNMNYDKITRFLETYLKMQ